MSPLPSPTRRYPFSKGVQTERTAVARREVIDHQLSELKDELAKVRARWEQEKKAIDAIRARQKAQEDLLLELEAAERRGDLARASELKYGALKAGEAQLKAARRGRVKKDW